MRWAEYAVTFAAPDGREIVRHIRAVSEADAKWRVVREFLLPTGSEIIGVERSS